MISIVIVDDHQPTIESIKTILENNFGHMIISTASSIEQLDAMRNIKEFDIYLMDIEIGPENGIEYGIKIRQTNRKSDLIFITSYDSYALEGYKASANGYLLKPVKERELVLLLEQSLQKIDSRKYINIIENYKSITIDINDIVYINRVFRKTDILTVHKDIIETNENIKQLGLKTKGHFIQINKSILVNPLYIKKLDPENKRLTLWNKETFQISRHYYKTFHQSLIASRN